MTKLNPYLFFSGNCEEAFNFYKTVFGKEALFNRYKDVPQKDKHLFKEEDDKIMHVSLQISREVTLMGCDITTLPKLLTPNNNFALYLNTDTKEEADRLFHELSEGGQTHMPMTQTFWGSYYGTVTDKFGIMWKITFNL